MIPKLTNPLAKSIRTGEGILIWIVNAGIVVFSAINPSELPPEIAGILVSGLSALHLVSRTMLKATAVQKNIGIEAPIPFDAQDLVDNILHGLTGSNIKFNLSDSQVKSIVQRIESSGLLKDPFKTVEKVFDQETAQIVPLVSDKEEEETRPESATKPDGFSPLPVPAVSTLSGAAITASTPNQ
jgi:hypothetical protein